MMSTFRYTNHKCCDALQAMDVCGVSAPPNNERQHAMTFKLSDLLPCGYLDIDEAITNQQIFQDAEGKIPCTEDGQLVGLIHYSDGSVFLKEPLACNRPTLKSNKAGKHYIESVDGEWV